jgi:hypothetical protein
VAAKFATAAEKERCMNGAILAKIYAARVELRDRGEKDTQDAVLSIVGGSKSTVVKYWQASNPDTYNPEGFREASTHANGVTAPGGPTDAEFEASFEVLMQARIKFFACQEIAGDNPVMKLPYWAKHREGVHGLPSDHPLVHAIIADYDEKYDAHIDLWKQMVEPSPYAYHGWREPEPQVEPEPEPEPPAFDMANLEKYYFDRVRSPWPDGVGLPAEQAVYDILRQLHQEADALEIKTGRERYTVMNTLGAIPGTRDETPLRQAADRWSAARFLAHRIKSDMAQMEEQARYEGRTLA